MYALFSRITPNIFSVMLCVMPARRNVIQLSVADRRTPAPSAVDVCRMIVPFYVNESVQVFLPFLH